MSERLANPVVAVRDRASGRYLATGASWSADAADALLLDELEAVELLARFACEPDGMELVRRSRAVHAA